jgi:Cu+-exporting ATPase
MAGKAEIFYDRSKTSPQDICDWITSLGFPTTLQNNTVGKTGRTLENGTAEVELQISGMTCSSCVYNIESHVAKLNGIIEARVALSTQKGVFIYDPDRVGPRQIMDSIIVGSIGVLQWPFGKMHH